jgi:uncharacterized membrane protein YbaN (DUF454 family)
MTYKKLGYLVVGWLSLALGTIGIVLPLLPTTPFVLLSAYCFSKSSVRFHRWLLTHKVFGPLVRDWEQGGVIRIKAKILATVSIVLMLSLSFSLLNLSVLAMGGICASVACVMIYIWTRPSSIKVNE